MITNAHANLILIIALAMTPLTSLALESDKCDGTIANPCVVQDTFNNSPNARHWRTALMLAEKYQGNKTGLDNLSLSASGMPSIAGFAEIYRQINSIKRSTIKQIIDIDLREEDHAYLNQDAITLTSEYDWINKGKSHEEAIASEKEWIKSLRKESVINNVLNPSQFKSGQFEEGFDKNVESITSERATVEKIGFIYRRFTISDHMAPSTTEVDKFVSLINNTKNDSWYHIHCRAGNGRTTTFMAMLDMLFNAKQVSFNDIIQRQAAVEPFYDLSIVDRGDPTLTQFYVERYLFLRAFYEYAIARQDGYSGTWTQWLASSK